MDNFARPGFRKNAFKAMGGFKASSASISNTLSKNITFEMSVGLHRYTAIHGCHDSAALPSSYRKIPQYLMEKSFNSETSLPRHSGLMQAGGCLSLKSFSKLRKASLSCLVI